MKNALKKSSGKQAAAVSPTTNQSSPKQSTKKQSSKKTKTQPSAKKQSTPKKSTPRPPVIKGAPVLNSVMRLKIEGPNQIRLLNTLYGSVTVKNIIRTSNSQMQLDIAKKDAQKTFAILQKMCYTYTIVGESGGKGLFFRAVAHLGLIISLVIFLSAGIVLSRMVWTIDVSGNESLDTRIILNTLKTGGVHKGVFSGDIDTGKAASLLRGIDGVAQSTVYIRGTTLKVYILEEKSFIPPDSPVISSDLISAYDAEITKIITLKGTKTVKTGDRVAKGETLIKGEIYNTNGELMESVCAEGEVYGRVAYKETYYIPATEYIKTRTGKTKKSTTLSLLRLKIGKSPALNWDRETSVSKLVLLPIKVTRTTYYQTEITQRECDIAAQTKVLKERAIVESAIKATESELECVTTLTQTDGGYLLNVYVTAEILISTEKIPN